MGNSGFKEDTHVYGLNVFILSDYELDKELFLKFFNITIPEENIAIPKGGCIKYNYPLCQLFNIIQYGVFSPDKNEDKDFDFVIERIKANVQSSQTEMENNLIICFISNENSALPSDLLTQFMKMYSHYQPPIIFCAANYKNLEYIINTNTNILYDKKMISYASNAIDKRDILINLIMKYYCYFSQYHEPNALIPMLNDKALVNLFNVYNNKMFTQYIINENLSTKYTHSINIMVVGRPGVGKSSLINAMLGERRCKESAGRCVTNKIKLFRHKSINLSIYDTPGFEDKKGSEIIIKHITEFNGLDGSGNKKKKQNDTSINYNIHLLLYLVNASTRTLLDGDEQFISFCLENKLPILFVLTRCESESKARDAKEILSNDLNKIDTFLSKKVVCLQLKNEPESNIKSFGFAELMEKISDYLISQKNVSHEFLLRNINKVDRVISEGEENADQLISYFKSNNMVEDEDGKDGNKWEYAYKWLIKSIGCGFGIDISPKAVKHMYDIWSIDSGKSWKALKKRVVTYAKEYITEKETFLKYIERTEKEYNEGINSIKNILLTDEFSLF
jgi:GTP-binding protein EngB required for normal cell division